MNIEILLIELRTELINLKDHVSAAGKSQLYNTHNLAERVVLPIFQKIFGYKGMRNLNDSDGDNFPAIDLADDDVHVAIQISGSEELTKVKSMLKTFLDKSLEGTYPTLFLYVLTEKQKSYSQKSIDKLTKGRLQFSGKQHVLDFTDVCQKAKSASPEAIHECVERLRSYLRSVNPAQRPAWLVHVPRSATELPVFSPPWFLYTEEKIQLIGRDDDLNSLLAFANGTDSFSWWTVSGPGGIGKSRLAHELVSRLAPEWDAGFASPESVPGPEQLRVLDKPTLIIIDYAARHTGKVRELLLRCAANQAHLRSKVRILLLERESGDGVQWWDQLMTTDSGSALIRQSLHAPARALAPLGASVQAILRAWLVAGAPAAVAQLPPADDKYWRETAERTEGLPLLIGIAAAAFSRAPGVVLLRSMKEMLKAVLDRELERWRLRCGNQQQLFDAVVTINGLGTLLRGLPLVTATDFVALTTAKQVLVIQDMATGQSRLPTAEWLARSGNFPEQLRLNNESILQALQPLVKQELLQEALEISRSLCPQRWTLQPDLVGALLLEEWWNPPPYFVTAGPTPVLDDAALTRLLAAAWTIAATHTVSTFIDLRNTTSSPALFRRALTRLTSVAADSGGSDTGGLEMLVFLLYNATFNVGKQKTSEADRQAYFDAISLLHQRYPDNVGITYRFLKTKIRQLAGQPIGAPASLSERTALLRQGCGILASWSEPESFFYLSLADQLQIVSSFAWEQQDGDLLAEVMAAARLLHARFTDDTKLRSVLTRYYARQAAIVAGMRQVPGHTGADTLTLRSSLLPPVADAILDDIASPAGLDQESKESLALALLNVSMARSLIESKKDVEALRARIAAVASWLPAELARRITLQFLYNLHTACLREDDLVAATAALRQADLAQRLCRVQSIAYLAMIRQGAQVGAKAGDWDHFDKHAAALPPCLHLLDGDNEVFEHMAAALDGLLDPAVPVASRQRFADLLATAEAAGGIGNAMIDLCRGKRALLGIQLAVNQDEASGELQILLGMMRAHVGIEAFQQAAAEACLEFWVRHTKQDFGQVHPHFTISQHAPKTLQLTILSAALGAPLIGFMVPMVDVPRALAP